MTGQEFKVPHPELVSGDRQAEARRSRLTDRRTGQVYPDVTFGQLMARLKAYEDLGLSPEEIREALFGL